MGNVVHGTLRAARYSTIQRNAIALRDAGAKSDLRLQCPQIDSERLSGKNGGRRSALPVLSRPRFHEPSLHHRIRDDIADVTEGAQPVQNRSLEARFARGDRVGMQRVEIAVQPIQKGGVLGDGDTNRSVGWRCGYSWKRCRSGACRTTAAVKPAGVRVNDGRNRLGVVCSAGSFSRRWQTSPFPPPCPRCSAFAS